MGQALISLISFLVYDISKGDSLLFYANQENIRI